MRPTNVERENATPWEDLPFLCLSQLYVLLRNELEEELRKIKKQATASATMLIITLI